MARVQQNYRMVGGATAGLFPAVEQQLANGSLGQKAMLSVLTYKDPSKYKSVIDFLLCEFFPEWRPSVRQAYEKKDVCLSRTLITPEEYLKIEGVLKKVVDVAYELKLSRSKHLLSWRRFREQVSKNQMQQEE
jgi:hypothetical protein